MKPIEVMEEVCVAVASDQDIVSARMRGRTMALQLGFRATDATLIATAISELARNILLYAKRGERTRALETYRRALGLKPSDRVERELTTRLRALEAKNAAGR